jgi:hypothetical protein
VDACIERCLLKGAKLEPDDSALVFSPKTGMVLVLPPCGDEGGGVPDAVWFLAACFKLFNERPAEAKRMSACIMDLPQEGEHTGPQAPRARMWVVGDAGE